VLLRAHDARSMATMSFTSVLFSSQLSVLSKIALATITIFEYYEWDESE
jgi:hypothetical protein